MTDHRAEGPAVPAEWEGGGDGPLSPGGVPHALHREGDTSPEGRDLLPPPVGGKEKTRSEKERASPAAERGRPTTIVSAAILGIDAYPVAVEVDVRPGLPAFNIVGLPDNAVRESKERVMAAIRNTGILPPAKRITVNLAPADIRKDGSAFDLPIALGLLSGLRIFDAGALEGFVVLGELSLDGTIRSVRGVLSVAAMILERRMRGLILPPENAAEASVVSGVDVWRAATLDEMIRFCREGRGISKVPPARDDPFGKPRRYSIDFKDVIGQAHAKRALEVAAAGSHNVLMSGPPGSGKTMLARRLPTILPDLTFEEALETSKIYSAAGLLQGKSLITHRTFCAPHHTISDAGLIGGGRMARCGQVSLAHNGVLFLDEFPEFRRAVLEALRQPLEDHVVTVCRVSATVTYPARFMLVAAMNPCPCGYLTDPRHECTCSPLQLQRYTNRISGPLLDRIDIQIEVPAVPFQEMLRERGGESSATIRRRVNRARVIQRERFAGRRIHCNAQMEQQEIEAFCPLTPEGRRLLSLILDRFSLSARAYARIVKVARTIADLSGSETIEAAHLSEAIQFRSLDRRLAGRT